MAADREMSFSGHPDVAEMRVRYERVAQSTVIQGIDGVTVLTGLFIALSPWIVGFNRFPTLTANNLIIGLAVAIFGMGLASAYDRTYGVSWVLPLLGVWTIVSVWAVNGSVATLGSILSNVIAGAIVVILGLATLGAGMMQRAPRNA